MIPLDCPEARDLLAVGAAMREKLRAAAQRGFSLSADTRLLLETLDRFQERLEEAQLGSEPLAHTCAGKFAFCCGGHGVAWCDRSFVRPFPPPILLCGWCRRSASLPPTALWGDYTAAP